jgi:hypothetical protein
MGFAPAGREVVGRKIAVFKPKAGEWAQGKVVEYNSATSQHKVKHALPS